MRLTTLALTAALFAAPAMAADYTILKVGDSEIKKSEVMDIWQGLFPPGQAPDFDTFDESMKQNVLRGMVSEHLLFEEAKKKGMDKSPEVTKQLAVVKRKLSVKAFLDDQSDSLITEGAVKKAYDALVREKRDEREVRARHILVKDEATAKELHKKIEEGADFEELAKENSMDPGSAKTGGDLGYFTKERMVPEFSKAAFALDKGEVSAPVKSDFGWHIIRQVDKRRLKVPTYNDVKEKLRLELQEEKLNEFVERLLDKASVQYLDEKGKELDFSKMPEGK